MVEREYSFKVQQHDGSSGTIFFAYYVNDPDFLRPIGHGKTPAAAIRYVLLLYQQRAKIAMPTPDGLAGE